MATKEKSKVFFSEEKKQKTFMSCSRPACASKKQKFFGSFFQKRTFFLFSFGSPHASR
jgi:hypothetical protein